MGEEARVRWRNWAGDQVARPFSLARPWTREGLVKAITDARSHDRRIRMVGTGHSFSEAALSDGAMIHLGGLDRILDVDRSSGLVRVEGGITLKELNERLDGFGLALENLGDIDHQTLAGSIATATHGTGARFTNLSAQVEEIELIGADGTTTILNANDRDSTAFKAARVSVGALGAIYAVTLRTVPAFTLERIDRPRPLAEVLGSLDEIVDGIDHFEFYVFPHTETAICRESTRTGAPPEPKHPAAIYAQEVMLENWVGAGFVRVARHVPPSRALLSRIAAAGVSSSRKLDKSYRVFASERRIRFTEMEYAIPRRRAREAVDRVLSIASRPEFGVTFPIEVRFVAADDALLSPTHERDSCYIAVHHDRKLEWRPYFREVEATLAALDGRPHWGKRNGLGHTDLAGRYPRFGDFLEVRAELDPDGAFANAYTDRVLGPVGGDA